MNLIKTAKEALHSGFLLDFFWGGGGGGGAKDSFCCSVSKF